MSIKLDYENYAQCPWTLVAEIDNCAVASCCGSILEDVQLKMDCLLIELGYDLYFTKVEEDGFVIY